MRILALPLILFSLAVPSLNEKNFVVDHSNDVFNLSEYEFGHYEIIGVKDNTLQEYRVYSSEFSSLNIDKISSTAFDDCDNLKSIMISNNIKSVGDDIFVNCKSFLSIYFTGSEDEYLALFNEAINHYVYAYDEGFINFWNEEIRPESTSNLCDISKNKYEYAFSKYSALNDDDKEFVNNYADKSGSTIKSSIDFLIDFFDETPAPNVEKKEMNKSTALGLIITASIIGMTSICVFFFLKSKNIID